MRWIIMAIASLCLMAPLATAAEPLVEKYLHSGQLARGERVLEAALAAAPADDQLRFGLAVLQLVRSVERLGQGLHEYGCKSENVHVPILRLPVPHNPNPSPITYLDFQRMLDGFRADLATVEATLAGVKADNVTLPLRLADIRLDLTGKGEASERFVEILKKLLGPGFRLPEDNPQFLVCFDRGDAPWLRAYCHLLMSLVDLHLAFNSEPNFDMWADTQFARPKHPFVGTPEEKKRRMGELGQVAKITDPARLGHFRRHMLKVCELNRETWTCIRAETDNDHEWLPNSKQTGVLRISVTDEMIEAWLSAVTEVEALFNGTKVLPRWLLQFVHSSAKKGMNLRRFYDDPPDEIDFNRVCREGVREKYLDDTLPDADLNAFSRVYGLFQNPMGVGYVGWFN